MPLIKRKTGVRIMTKFRECNVDLYTNLDNVLHKNVITQLDFLFENYKINWHNRILSQNVGKKERS